jgi:ligand-binding sensor domain-containing protein
MVLLVLGANVQALKPGLWTIIKPDGLLVDGILQTNNGIQGKQIEDIALTPEGNLWLAAKEGVYQVKMSANSLEFERHAEFSELTDIAPQTSVADTVPMLANAALAAVDHAGIIWYVPVNKHVLLRFDPVKKISLEFNTENAPIKGKIHKILSDSNNYKYILAGDEQKSIYIIKEPVSSDGWTVINPLLDGWNVLNQNFWDAACFKADGTFYAVNRIVTDNYHISMFSEKEWTQEPYTLGNTKLLFQVYSAAYAGENLYVGTNGSLYALKKGKLSQVTDINKKMLSDKIRALTTDHNNRLWIGSAEGLAVFDSHAYTYFNKKSSPGLPSVNVLSLCAAMDKVFVGTAEGLSVYDHNSWTAFDKKKGLENKRVNALAANSKGQVFIGAVTASGNTDVLAVYENGKLTGETIPRSIYITQMVTDEDDNLWIAGENDLACRKSSGEYVFYEVEKTPLSLNYSIRNIAVVNHAVHISVTQQANQANTSESFGNLTSFDPNVLVFIMKVKD